MSLRDPRVGCPECDRGGWERHNTGEVINGRCSLCNGKGDRTGRDDPLSPQISTRLCLACDGKGKRDAALYRCLACGREWSF